MEVLLSTYTFDVFIVAATFAVIALYNSIRGVGISLIVAVIIPIASFLYSIFPYHSQVADFAAKILPLHSNIVASSVIFSVLLAVSLAIPRTITRSGFNERRLWRIVAVSTITTIFVLILTFKTLSLDEFGLFSENAVTILSNDTFSFWVLIFSLIALFFV